MDEIYDYYANNNSNATGGPIGLTIGVTWAVAAHGVCIEDVTEDITEDGY